MVAIVVFYPVGREATNTVEKIAEAEVEDDEEDRIFGQH